MRQGEEDCVRTLTFTDAKGSATVVDQGRGVTWSGEVPATDTTVLVLESTAATTDQLPTVIGTGTKDLPGFLSAQDLTAGKLTPDKLAIRASGWEAKLSQIQGRVESITVGQPPAEAGTDGEPANSVGGR